MAWQVEGRTQADLLRCFASQAGDSRWIVLLLIYLAALATPLVALTRADESDFASIQGPSADHPWGPTVWTR